MLKLKDHSPQKFRAIYNGSFYSRSRGTGEVEAVQTSKHTLYSKKAIVVSAGCWSGSLMHDLLKETRIVLDVPVRPRKVGFLDLD